MANLSESSTFDAGVYQLELTDPVIGGPSGVSNAPLKNLANRTKYLKDHVDALESSRAPLASPTFTGNPAAPTPSQFDNDTSLATTEFVQRALGNLRGVLSYSGSPNLSADQAGNAIFFTGSGGNVATLPALSASADGNVFYFKNLTSANVTIQRAGSDYLYINNLQDTSITLAVGEDICFVKGSAASWWSFGGTGGLKKAASFGASLGNNYNSGYQKLPSGLIIQWGYKSVTSGASQRPADVTFPIAFPNAVFAVTAAAGVDADSLDLAGNYRNDYTWTNVALPKLTGVTVQVYLPIDTANGRNFQWMAVGR